MNNSLESKFFTSCSAKVLDILSEINSCGFKAGLIGGVVRDFLLSGTISPDIDIELRLINSEDDLLSSYESLISRLKLKYNLSTRGYSIYSFKVDKYELELTLPRQESYLKDDQSHKNFTHKFIKDDNYSTGFLRRDFSINSIMLEFIDNQFSLVDPLNGVQDLQAKLLKVCSTNFSKDPVRYLRAIRFSVKYDLSFSKDLETIMQNMTKEYSSFYLKNECIKSSKPFTFFSKINFFENKVEVDFNNIQLIEYETRFAPKLSLREFIQFCFYLPIDKRRYLLRLLNLKTKGLMTIGPDNVGELRRHDGKYPTEIIDFFEGEFLD